MSEWKQHERHDFWVDSELCHGWDRVNYLWGLSGHFYTTLAWALEICAGLRRAELINLRVADCQTAGYPAVYVRNGKGGKSRDVELIPEFGVKFTERIEQLKGMGHEFVFQHHYRRKPLSIRRANDLWNEAVQALGLRDYWVDSTGKRRPMGIHAGRRTFSTMARLLFYEADGQRVRISLDNLQAQLGHVKLDTTLRYYARSLVGQRWVPKALEWPKHI